MARGTSTTERVRRLVALLGQLTSGSRISVAELAADVVASEAELAADLETLALCGVAPYDPSDLVPIFIEDGVVEVWGEVPAMRGPVRLSAAEARALAAALQTAGIGSDDSLTSRLLHAAATGGFDAHELERTVRAASSAHEAHVYETLAAALQTHRVVHIEYVRAGSEELTARAIEPLTLFAERGAWYVTAWCRRAGDWRTFRLDRIRSAAESDESFEADASADTGTSCAQAAFDSQGLPNARLRFDSPESFSEREWPGAQITEQTGSGVFVSVPYSGTHWIARRVVARLGAVEALAPDEVRAAVRELAERSRA